MTQIHASELAKKQKEIGVAEFFAKNRHLLGFDNKVKALMTTIKEAVDNALDACEEARILPEIIVEVTDLGNDKFKIAIEDNGPGIVKKQMGKIFGKLLYGSKFHKLGQSLTKDEPILIQKDGKVSLVPIGEFVDKYVSEEGDINISHEDIYAPAFNKENGKYAFKKVSHAIKHKQQHDIYKISLKGGRSIKVTDCHSVFGLDDDFSIKDIQAKNLKVGDYLVSPKKIPEPTILNSINILESISLDVAKNQNWYVYGFSKKNIQEIFSQAKIIHKKTSKSRKFFQICGVDVLDDSYKQYEKKGFLPLYLVKQLGIETTDKQHLQTYFHGKSHKIPLVWSLTPAFMRFLGFFVSEGHIDSRQIGFTFGKTEKQFVKEVCDFALYTGINNTIEHREEKNCIRVKLFGGVLSTLLKSWCGKGAKYKKIPEFIFQSNFENRQHFLDALYQGDGCNTKNRNQLMHSTVSPKLANDLLYLWLLQGQVAHQSLIEKGNLGKHPSKSYVTTIYGDHTSFVHKTQCPTKSKTIDFLPKNMFADFDAKKAVNSTQGLFQSIGLGFSEKQFEKYFRCIVNEDFSKLNKHNLNHLCEKGFIKINKGLIQLTKKTTILKQKIKQMQSFFESDLCLLKISSIEKLSLKDEWVYDISIPGDENFIGGFGGVAAHNSRGQQGIGISACVMYAQLTTGKPAKIISKTGKVDQAIAIELKLDTQTNEPIIVKEIKKDWSKDSGTRIELDMEASYQRGSRSIDEYLKQTAITNPHATIIYVNPKGEQLIFPRVSEDLPPPAQEIKPHPYGVELGFLLDMITRTDARTLQAFLTTEFSRVSPSVAKEICENAALLPNTKPLAITRDSAEKIIEAIKKTKIMAPPSDCLSPITAQMLERGLRKEINAEFYASISRPPAVYRGNPFIVEAAIAYGGDQGGDSPINVMRFANRVPLLYQQGACAGTKAVVSTAWKNYNLQQSKGNLPIGPCSVAIHIASVWVPFTSESKEAIAHYPEIIKEMKLALQEVGRQLGSYIGKKKRVGSELKKRSYIEKYIPFVSEAIVELLELEKHKADEITENLKDILEKERGKIEDMKFDPKKNEDYDEEFANIGKEDSDEKEFDEEKEDEF